jgi:hypothetical protein
MRDVPRCGMVLGGPLVVVAPVEPLEIIAR